MIRSKLTREINTKTRAIQEQKRNSKLRIHQHHQVEQTQIHNRIVKLKVTCAAWSGRILLQILQFLQNPFRCHLKDLYDPKNKKKQKKGQRANNNTLWREDSTKSIPFAFSLDSSKFRRRINKGGRERKL